jgi:hypothetical protein
LQPTINKAAAKQLAIVVSTCTNYMPRIGGSKAHMKASKPAAENNLSFRPFKIAAEEKRRSA